MSKIKNRSVNDRRERELSVDDIAHYMKIVRALGETIRLMRRLAGGR
jgi:hypothetical protein